MLGEDRDLAVLRKTLAADPLIFGGHGILKSAFAIIDRLRGEMELQAFVPGHEIYRDQPRTFNSRIQTWTQ